MKLNVLLVECQIIHDISVEYIFVVRLEVLLFSQEQQPGDSACVHTLPTKHSGAALRLLW